MINVWDQILENMGVTPEQLHADALENAPQIKPAEIKGMSEVISLERKKAISEQMKSINARRNDEKMLDNIRE